MPDAPSPPSVSPTAMQPDAKSPDFPQTVSSPQTPLDTHTQTYNIVLPLHLIPQDLEALSNTVQSVTKTTQAHPKIHSTLYQLMTIITSLVRDTIALPSKLSHAISQSIHIYQFALSLLKQRLPMLTITHITSNLSEIISEVSKYVRKLSGQIDAALRIVKHVISLVEQMSHDLSNIVEQSSPLCAENEKSRSCVCSGNSSFWDLSLCRNHYDVKMVHPDLTGLSSLKALEPSHCLSEHVVRDVHTIQQTLHSLSSTVITVHTFWKTLPHLNHPYHHLITDVSAAESPHSPLPCVADDPLEYIWRNCCSLDNRNNLGQLETIVKLDLAAWMALATYCDRVVFSMTGVARDHYRLVVGEEGEEGGEGEDDMESKNSSSHLVQFLREQNLSNNPSNASPPVGNINAVKQRISPHWYYSEISEEEEFVFGIPREDYFNAQSDATAIVNNSSIL